MGKHHHQQHTTMMTMTMSSNDIISHQHRHPFHHHHHRYLDEAARLNVNDADGHGHAMHTPHHRHHAIGIRGLDAHAGHAAFIPPPSTFLHGGYDYDAADVHGHGYAHAHGRGRGLFSMGSSISLPEKGSVSGLAYPALVGNDEMGRRIDEAGLVGKFLELGLDDGRKLPSYVPVGEIGGNSMIENFGAGMPGIRGLGWDRLSSFSPRFDFDRRGFVGREELNCRLGVNPTGTLRSSSLFRSENLGSGRGGLLPVSENGRNLKWDGSAFDSPSNLHCGFAVLNDGTLELKPEALVRGLRSNNGLRLKDSLVLKKGVSSVGNQQQKVVKMSRKLHFAESMSLNGCASMDDDISATLSRKYDHMMGVEGFIYHLAKDQYGCRFLQQKFDKESHMVDVIFSGIIDHVLELAVHPFGNYLIQKLLDICSEEQRTEILLMLTEDFSEIVNVSINIHGTRVVQRLIETVKTRQQRRLVTSALQPGFLHLIKDSNGNHVIQRCLESFTPSDNKFIFDAAARHCVEIANDRHGCCVLQRCLDHASGENLTKLVLEISANGLELACDPFGNYVIQYILKLKHSLANAKLAYQFEGKYVQLSVQKFSSNVVERCLKYFSDDYRNTIILELLSVPHFEQLLQDPYANYVVQSALRNSKGSIHAALIEAVRPYAAFLKTNPHCKRLFSPRLLKKK